MRRAAAAISILLLGFAYGIAAGHYRFFPHDEIERVGRALFGSRSPVVEDNVPAGRWYERRVPAPEGAAEREAVESLSRLGYLGGYSGATGENGVTFLDAPRVQEGLTLFSSGHAPSVQLIDAGGEVVHRWEVAFADLWPNELPFRTRQDHKQFIRRARLLPGGDLLIIFEYIGIARLDASSKVLWKNLGRNHHDLDVAADGSIVTLARRELSPAEMAAQYPGFDTPEEGILDDELVLLDASGVELNRFSLFESLYRSDYATLLNTSQGWDVLHANSVDIVTNADPGLGPMIANGDVLVSFRNLNAVASVDPADGSIRWMLSGKWRWQHQAQLLDNGNILLLDNLGGNTEAPFLLDKSQVLEVDPRTQEIVWRYGGSDESPFFTYLLGYVQRLPNGNTLITESTQGRIFEVTEQGELVWEFFNPHRAGENDELIATVMGARRLGVEDLAFLRR